MGLMEHVSLRWGPPMLDAPVREYRMPLGTLFSASVFKNNVILVVPGATVEPNRVAVKTDTDKEELTKHWGKNRRNQAMGSK